ncbi:MAG: DNA internalization-related competence protein ComEC/Rec2 [Gemmatimonadota bacterium]
MRAPPGAMILLVAYGAGLVTGLSRFLDPVILLPLLLAAGWVLRRSTWAVTAIACASGIAVGCWSRTTITERCVASLRPGEQQLVLRTEEPGSATGRVSLPTRGCRGDVVARWPVNANVGAGHDVGVVARWIPRPPRLGRPDGLLVVTRVLRVTGDPGRIDSLRTVLTTASVRLYGAQSPLVDALITGRRGAIDPTLSRAFAAAGLVHLLAISGSHIAVIAGWVLLVLRLLRVSRHRGEALAVAAATGYTAFIGWPPSAVRAAALMALVAWCRWRQRHVRGVALLGASALLVLWCDAWAISDVGAWLSVLALAGVSAATRWSDRAISASVWVRTLSGSVGATLTTAPLTAFAFGQVAPIGILLNLVAVPLTALLVPVLLVSLLLWHPLPVAASAFATSAALLLRLLVGVARVGAMAPGAATAGDSGFAAALPWLVALAAAGWVVYGQTAPREAARRLGWVVAVVLWLLLAPRGPRAPDLGSGGLALLFADVGQGDAALIRTPGGHWFAVDAGPIDPGGRDAGHKVLLPLLAQEQVGRLEALILSHAHRDHVGGAAALVNELDIGVVVEPGEAFSDSAYDDWLTAVAQRGVRWHPARRGTEWTVDGVRFAVLHPPLEWPRQGDDLNEDSVVLSVSYGNFTALLMGDAGFVAESSLAGSLPEADLLKVGHHGSRWASGVPFLAMTRPVAGIISVGRNRYGHPAPETLARLADAGTRVWRTDLEGTTTVLTDGVTFTVHGGRTSATYAARARRGPRRRRAGTPPRTDQGDYAGALHPGSGARPSRCHGGAHQPPL